jgi:chloramphenicol-sensitive protein RarD
MQTEDNIARQGVIYAISAYLMWGIAPIYFKYLHGVAALEILGHRIVWSFVFLAILIHTRKQWGMVQQTIRLRRKWALLSVTALLVGANWLIFIWAINNDHLLDASLGYYINPLLNVILGMLFLGERLRRLQWFAVFLATVGVVIQLIVFGSIPIVAIGLAITFGLYGLLRKKVAVDSQTGLFIETLMLLPLALIYLLLIAQSPTSNMFINSLSMNGLLMLAGIVTTLPLLCFAGAATRLRLSTLGFFQYIGPSIMFVLATVFYGEPLTLDKLVTFAFIWLALVVFSADGLRQRKRPMVQQS